MDGFPQVIAFAFLVNDVLVDLSRGQIIILGEADVKEALVVPQVKVDFPTVIQHKNLTCDEQQTWSGEVENLSEGKLESQNVNTRIE